MEHLRAGLCLSLRSLTLKQREKKTILGPVGVALCDCNPHTQESEVEECGVQDQQDPRKDGKPPLKQKETITTKAATAFHLLDT